MFYSEDEKRARNLSTESSDAAFDSVFEYFKILKKMEIYMLLISLTKLYHLKLKNQTKPKFLRTVKLPKK